MSILTTRGGRSWLTWGSSKTAEWNQRQRKRQRNNIARRLESLEDRTLLNATMAISATGDLIYNTDTAASDRVAISASGTTYQFQAGVNITVTNSSGLTVTGGGTHTVTVTGLPSHITVNVLSETGHVRLVSSLIDTAVNLNAANAYATLGDLGPPGAIGLDALRGKTSVNAPSGGLVILQDEGNSDPGFYDVTETTVKNSFSSLFGGLEYAGLRRLELLGSDNKSNFRVFSTAGATETYLAGGAGPNTFYVGGTSNDPNSSLDLAGSNSLDNQFSILGSSSPTRLLFGGGSNVARLGNNGVTADINSQARVFMPSETPGPNDVFLDNSRSSTAGDWNLALKQIGAERFSQVTGFSAQGSLLVDARSPSPALHLLNAQGFDNSLTVDFGNGNPIPPTPMNYDGGASVSSTGPSNLILKGGSITNEVHDAQAAGAGSITADGRSISYSGVSPQSVYDVAPATNYTFNNMADAGVPVVIKEGADSPLTGNAQSLLITAPGAFADTHVANKTSVTINANTSPSGGSTSVNYGIVAPVVGLSGLIVATNGGDDTAHFLALPPGVGVSLRQGAGGDRAIVSVRGTAIATSAVLDGGSAENTLILDAGGLAITPDNFKPGPSGETNVSVAPLTGSPITYINYDHIRVNNLPPVAPIVTAAALKANPGQALVNVAVGTFTTAAMGAKAGDFNATIDWGDGTPVSAGWILQDAANPSVFHVMGTHTYRWSATPLTTTLTVVSNGSAGERVINGVPVTFATPAAGAVSAQGTATAGNGPLTLTGRLSPASDSGVSDSDGITNVAQPNFLGTSSEPGAVVLLYATAQGGSPMLIGQAAVDAAGAWSITANTALADGGYLIQAQAQDGSGGPAGALTTITQNLVIDTVGPKVADARLDNFGGRVHVTLQDFGGVANQGSGLVQASLIDANNYRFSFLSSPVRGYRGAPQWLVISVNVQPGTNSGPQAATILLNGGRPFRGGRYQFNVQSADPNNQSGVRDLAGNPLDGEFYSFFPSGNNVRGGDFTSRLGALHRRNFAPGTLIGPATPVSPPGRPGMARFVGWGFARPSFGPAFRLAGSRGLHRPPMSLVMARPGLASLRD